MYWCVILHFINYQVLYESVFFYPFECSHQVEKWKDIKFDESHRHVLSEALHQGQNVYGITVKVQESCILKAARAFLVFKALEDLGEIMISNPPVQDIEDEKFDLDFSIIYISENSLEKIISVIKNVSILFHPYF